MSSRHGGEEWQMTSLIFTPFQDLVKSNTRHSGPPQMLHELTAQEMTCWQRDSSRGAGILGLNRIQSLLAVDPRLFRGGGPAARVNIRYGPHQNFYYPS